MDISILQEKFENLRSATEVALQKLREREFPSEEEIGSLVFQLEELKELKQSFQSEFARVTGQERLFSTLQEMESAVAEREQDVIRERLERLKKALEEFLLLGADEEDALDRLAVFQSDARDYLESTEEEQAQIDPKPYELVNAAAREDDAKQFIKPNRILLTETFNAEFVSDLLLGIIHPKAETESPAELPEEIPQAADDAQTNAAVHGEPSQESAPAAEKEEGAAAEEREGQGETTQAPDKDVREEQPRLEWRQSNRKLTATDYENKFYKNVVSQSAKKNSVLTALISYPFLSEKKLTAVYGEENIKWLFNNGYLARCHLAQAGADILAISEKFGAILGKESVRKLLRNKYFEIGSFEVPLRLNDLTEDNILEQWAYAEAGFCVERYVARAYRGIVTKVDGWCRYSMMHGETKVVLALSVEGAELPEGFDEGACVLCVGYDAAAPGTFFLKDGKNAFTFRYGEDAQEGLAEFLSAVIERTATEQQADGETANKMTEAVAEERIEKPAEEAAEQAIEEPAEERIEKPAEAVAEPVEGPAEEAAEQAIEEPAEETPVAAPGEKPVAAPEEKLVAAPEEKLEDGEEGAAQSSAEPTSVEVLCKALFEEKCDPAEAPERYMAVVNKLLSENRVWEAGFFVDCVAQGLAADAGQAQALQQEKIRGIGDQFALLRDQIQYIANISGWCQPTPPDFEHAFDGKWPEITETALIASRLVYRLCFPQYQRIDFEMPRKEEFENLSLGDTHTFHNNLVSELMKLNFAEGGFQREDVPAMVSSQETLDGFASRAAKFASPSNHYKGHFGERKGVEESIARSDLTKCLNVIAAKETARVSEVDAIVARDFNRPESFELDEKKLEVYLDDDLWEMAKKLCGEDTLPPTMKDRGRKEILSYLRERVVLVNDWLKFVRQHEQSKKSAKYVARPFIIKSAEALRDSIEVNGSVPAVLLRFAASRMVEFLKGDRPENPFEFVLAGNEFLLGEDGLPLMPEEIAGTEHLPSLSLRVVRHFMQAPLSRNAIAARIENADENDEWCGNKATAAVVSALLDRSLTEPYSALKIKNFAKAVSDEFASELEKEYLYGRITEIEKEELLHARKLLHKAYIESRVEYGKFRRGLQDLREELDRLIERRTDSFNQQLEQYRQSEDYSEAPILEDIAENIAEKNFVVAEENIARLERGMREIPAEERSEGNDAPLVVDFINCYDAIFNLANSSKNKSNVFSEWAKREFRGFLPEARAASYDKEATNYFAAWNLGGSKERAERLRALLLEHGFKLTGGRDLELGDCDSFEFIAEPSSKKLTSYPHPISEFGTELKRMYVLSFSGQSKADLIVDKVNRLNPNGTATIVFLHAPLAREKREEILAKFKATSRGNSFLLIDYVLGFYLGLQSRGNRLNALLQCTVPYTGYELFKAAVADLKPEMFISRPELRSLRDMSNSTYLVYGGRKLGKTALLNRASEIEDDGYKNFAVTVLIQQSKNDDERVFVNKLAEKLTEKGRELISDRQYESNRDICKALGSTLKRHTDWTIRLYIDEVDEYFEMLLANNKVNEALAPFIELRGAYPDRFKFVMAGLHHVGGQPRFLRDNNVIGQMAMSTVLIGPLKGFDARRLIEYPFAYLGIKIDPSNIALIAARANYYPGIIQEICLEIVRAIQRDPRKAPPYEVNEKLLEEICGSQEINSKIRGMIKMTLDLDPAYKAIAMMFVQRHYDDERKGCNSMGYSSMEFFNDVQNYEREELSSLSPEDVEILLDELVHMSILREIPGKHSGEKRYKLRKESFAEQIEPDRNKLMKYLLKED